MALDLEEQEKLETVKSWWRQYGKLVLAVIVAFLVTIAAFQGWRYYRQQQSAAAAILYEQLLQARRANEAKKVRDIALQIAEKYASTPYAALAGLAAARTGFETGDLAAAKAHLEWVANNAQEEEIRSLARLRLAGVYLDEKRYDEALALVDGKYPESFASLFADMKGDILVAQGKLAEARAAYQLALDRSDAQSPYRTMLQAKLDALGDTK